MWRYRPFHLPSGRASPKWGRSMPDFAFLVALLVERRAGVAASSNGVDMTHSGHVAAVGFGENICAHPMRAAPRLRRMRRERGPNARIRTHGGVHDEIRSSIPCGALARRIRLCCSGRADRIRRTGENGGYAELVRRSRGDAERQIGP